MGIGILPYFTCACRVDSRRHLSFNGLPSAPKARQHGAGEVHPYRKHVGGKRSDCAPEDVDRESPRHAAVLHPDFDGDRPRLGLAKMRKAPDKPRQPIAAGVADRVVHDRRDDDEYSGRGECITARRGERKNREAYARHRESRKNAVAGRLVPVEDTLECPMHETARRDGEYHDLQYLEHHLHRVDLHKASREDLHGKRGQHRRKERRAARHCDGERDVRLGEESDDVRRRAAGDRPHEDAPRRKLARKAKRLRKGEPDKRHHKELQHHARGDRPGTLRHAHEVGKRERRPHPEHDELYRRDDKRGQFDAAPFGERRRERKRNRGARKNRDAERLAAEKAGQRPGRDLVELR